MKENPVKSLNGKVAGARKALELGLAPLRKPSKPSLTVVVRQQTAEEQHRFRAAADALLLELVRQQMSRRSR